MKLILASTSVYRRALLERLSIPFETVSPQIDERPLPGELPAETAERLAREKAQAPAECFPQALIIGSDQVAYLDERIFGKPGTKERAFEQLTQMSGRTVVFHTALALFNSHTGRMQCEGIPTLVRFRTLSKNEITRYIDKELPLDCAGSAKSEGLGISLLEAMMGDDPTALVGLPLIALSHMLRTEGMELP